MAVTSGSHKWRRKAPRNRHVCTCARVTATSDRHATTVWRADGGPILYVYHEDGLPDAPTPDWIAQAIERRGVAKLERNFELADGILAGLVAEGVSLDDAKRTWRYLER